METTELKQQGNMLQVNFKVTHQANTYGLNVTSPQYICGPIYFQVNVTSARYKEVSLHIFAKFKKIYENDNMNYTCKVSSKDLDVNFTFNDENIWYKMHCHNCSNYEYSFIFIYSFDISVITDIARTAGPFASLYDDTDLTDFELKAEDGSVKLHKAVLASSSPVFKTMLRGKWKETADGRADVTGATKQTLEHFRDYIYLHKLPDSGLEPLLLLASYYMMPDLAQKCSIKLLNNLTAQNALELSEFALKYKLNNIYVTILKCVQNGMITVEDMPAYSNWNDICKEASSTLTK